MLKKKPRLKNYRVGMSCQTLMVLTSEFPPKGGSAVQRVLRFANHLSELRWNIFISTTSEKCHSELWCDASLYRKVSPSIHVARSMHPGINELFNRHFPRKKLKVLYKPLINLLNIAPDNFIDWFPFLYRASRKIIF